MATQTNAHIQNAAMIHIGSESADAVRSLRHQDTSNLRFMALNDIERMMPEHTTVIWCVGVLAVIDRVDYGYRKISIDPTVVNHMDGVAPQDCSVPAIGIACGVNKLGRGYFGTIVYDPSVDEPDYQVTWDPEVGHDERTLISTCFADAYVAAQELGAFKLP